MCTRVVFHDVASQSGYNTATPRCRTSKSTVDGWNCFNESKWMRGRSPLTRTTEQPRLSLLIRTGVVCLTDFAVSGRKQRFSYHEIIIVREVHTASRRWRHTLGRAQQSWLESLLTELEAVSKFHNIYGYFSDLHLWQLFVQIFFSIVLLWNDLPNLVKFRRIKGHKDNHVDGNQTKDREICIHPDLQTTFWEW